MNANRPTHEILAVADALPKRDLRAGVATPVASQARGGQAAASEVIINAAVTGAASVDSSTVQNASAAPTNISAPITHQAANVEAALQSALSVGESVRPDGQGQMEMRVRLGGGAEDVTVRLQVTNDRMQVTFQTNSPELGKALAHGWQQFSATAAQTSTLSLDQPRFESSRPGVIPGGSSDNTAFSSNQQNARQQDQGNAFADDSAAAATPARSSVPSAPATTPSSGQSSNSRLNRWA